VRVSWKGWVLIEKMRCTEIGKRITTLIYLRPGNREGQQTVKSYVNWPTLDKGNVQKRDGFLESPGNQTHNLLLLKMIECSTANSPKGEGKKGEKGGFVPWSSQKENIEESVLEKLSSFVTPLRR